MTKVIENEFKDVNDIPIKIVNNYIREKIPTLHIDIILRLKDNE